MTNSSILPIDRILSGATTPGQNRPGNNGSEGVLFISESSNTGVSSSDFFMSYPEQSVGGGLPSAEMQSVYSMAPS